MQEMTGVGAFSINDGFVPVAARVIRQSESETIENALGLMASFSRESNLNEAATGIPAN